MSEHDTDNAPASILSHVSLGTADMARATAFYDTVMTALGYGRVMEHGQHAVAYGTKFPEFWIQAPHDGKPPGSPSNGIHFAFLAPTKAAVDAFHEAALANGGSCDGPPGYRPEYGAPYYGTFVRDPDGHKIEAMLWDESVSQ